MNGVFKQLKGEFNNDNLSRFGEITCYVSGSATIAFYFNDSTSAQDVAYADAGSGVTLSFSGTGNNTINATGTGKFYVGNKYRIKNITLLSGGFNFNDAIHSPLTSLYLTGSYLGYNLSKLEQLSVFTGLKTLTLSTNIFAGQSIGDIANLTEITTFTLEGSGIVATMEQFGGFPNLTKVNTTYGMTLTGAIEDFVHVRRNLGQSTGDVDFFCVGNVTFNGAATLAHSHIVWTATTITWNGTTINA